MFVAVDANRWLLVNFSDDTETFGEFAERVIMDYENDLTDLMFAAIIPYRIKVEREDQ